jgi:hypothetical protein
LATCDPHALLDVVEDLLVAALIADQQKPEAVITKHLERGARHIGLGVAGPGDAELAELARDRLGARQVVGERVVVEEELLDLRKRLFRPLHFLDDMADGTGAVPMPADRLRPKAEGAARFAAPPGVKRHVGVLEVEVGDLAVAPMRGRVDDELNISLGISRNQRSDDRDSAIVRILDAEDELNRAQIILMKIRLDVIGQLRFGAIQRLQDRDVWPSYWRHGCRLSDEPARRPCGAQGA